MAYIAQDVAFAVRGLRRDWRVAALSVATLALGIGANAAMFGIADRLLLRGPDHVRDPGNLFRVYLTANPAAGHEYTTAAFGNVSYEVFSQLSVSGGSAAYFLADGVIGTGTDAQQIHIGYASASFFPLLGVRPAHGRFFSSEEDSPGAAQHVAVLGSSVLPNQFGGPDTSLRRVTINGEEYTVVGGAPAGFTGTELGPVDVWIPLNLVGPRVAPDWRSSWKAQWLKIVLRLRSGVSLDQAGAALTASHRAAYAGKLPEIAAARLSLRPLAASDSGVERGDAAIVRWLAAVAVIVLLTSCANVTNLLLARGARRGREFAIRAALGASRSGLVRLTLIESMLLVAAGGAAGSTLAYLFGHSAENALFPSVQWSSSGIDFRLMGMSAVVMAATGLLVSAVPAIRNTRADLIGLIKNSVRNGGTGHNRIRGALVIVQSALSFTLLVGAGLFVRSLWRVHAVSLGIDADHVLYAAISRPPLNRFAVGAAREAELRRRLAFYTTAAEEIRQLPGAPHAAVVVGLPFLYRQGLHVRPAGQDSLLALTSGGPSVSAVGADYFNTVGTRILSGRSFMAIERAGTERVVIVGNRMAQSVWPGRPAVGQCIFLFNDSLPCARVVGIAEDTHYGRLQDQPPQLLYVPLGQEIGLTGWTLLIRGSGSPNALIPDVRRVLLRVDPTVSFADLRTLQSIIEPQIRSGRIGAEVFSLMGVLAAIVAGIGTYGVTSFFVTQHTRETGIRIALGANRRTVVAFVTGRALLAALAGIAAGAGIALTCGKFVRPLLFNESPRDPFVFAAVAALLTTVAFAASVVPARRAVRIDPLDALRSE